MSDRLTLDRRAVLSAVGGIGAASFGAGTYAALSDRAATRARLTAGAVDLAVRYTGTVGGATVGSGTVADGEPITLSFPDLRPGSSGEVLFEFGVTSNPVWLWLCTFASRTDGGGGADEGADLWDALWVALSLVDENDRATVVASGTLAAVERALVGGLPVDGTGRPRPPGTQAALRPTAPGERGSVALRFEWELPADAGPGVEGDGVDVEFRFAARQARHASPAESPCADDGGGDPGGPRSGISFVAFCYEGEEPTITALEVTESKVEGGTREPLSIRWAADAPIEVVVLKEGFDRFGRGPDALENFAVGGATDGTATVGGGTAPAADQTPADPCPGDLACVKYEWNASEEVFEREA
ncbi:hypothetical protein [Halomarina pelagica]|uniref:hypothetical protein n=1 Tax=Halomarina pelagica TaxID=2961599 RepID=UPI0020C4AF9F|nr:hypothetical protein [Halomarina sp. BND7]